MKLAYNVYLLHLKYIICKSFLARGHHGRDRMVHVVGFTTTYATVTCDRSVVFSGYSGFLHQYSRQPRYN